MLVASSPLADRWEVPELAVRSLVARHGSRAADVLRRTAKSPRERAMLCACQAILECEVRHACRVEGARTLSDIVRRTGVGGGACRGLDCAHRTAQVLRDETGADASGLNEAVWTWLREGFARRAPFLDAADLGREELLLSRLASGGLSAHEEDEA